jgi:hypothetical protein
MVFSGSAPDRLAETGWNIQCCQLVWEQSTLSPPPPPKAGRFKEGIHYPNEKLRKADEHSNSDDVQHVNRNAWTVIFDLFHWQNGTSKLLEQCEYVLFLIYLLPFTSISMPSSHSTIPFHLLFVLLDFNFCHGVVKLYCKNVKTRIWRGSRSKWSWYKGNMYLTSTAFTMMGNTQNCANEQMFPTV